MDEIDGTAEGIEDWNPVGGSVTGFRLGAVGSGTLRLRPRLDGGRDESSSASENSNSTSESDRCGCWCCCCSCSCREAAASRTFLAKSDMRIEDADGPIEHEKVQLSEFNTSLLLARS